MTFKHSLNELDREEENNGIVKGNETIIDRAVETNEIKNGSIAYFLHGSLCRSVTNYFDGRREFEIRVAPSRRRAKRINSQSKQICLEWRLI